MRACDLNIAFDAIEQSAVRPTAALSGGWYRRRLRDLESSGSLVSVDMRNYSTEECVIVRRPGGSRADFRSECPGFATSENYNRNMPGSILGGFPGDQMTGGFLYTKEQVFPLRCARFSQRMGLCYGCNHEDMPLPVYLFPKWRILAGGDFDSPGGPYLDVHTAQRLLSEEKRVALKVRLDKLKFIRPAQFYETRIDPNVGAVNGTWVPTEFDTFTTPAPKVIAAIFAACRKNADGKTIPGEVMKLIFSFCGKDEQVFNGRCAMRSKIPDLDPHSHGHLYTLVEDVFEGALPLLACLKLPSLLLPGPLQVVVKAQSIVLGEGERYEGVWHDDGLREHVVAVVLFYYNVSNIEGGNLEFASKHRVCVGAGDFVGHLLNESGARSASRDLPHCIVPVSTGTYVVFSNYAAVHRVLPAETSGSRGSRDFLAFFVIDQKFPLPVPDDLGPKEARLHRRAVFLGEQLQTRGCFGLDRSSVYSTGNGCIAEVAWLAGAGQREVDTSRHFRGWFDEALHDSQPTVSLMNMPPPVIGRGTSYLHDLGSDIGDFALAEFKDGSPWIQYIIGEPVEFSVFAHAVRYEFQDEVPEEGISGIRILNSRALFLEKGYWRCDDALRWGS